MNNLTDNDQDNNHYNDSGAVIVKMITKMIFMLNMPTAISTTSQYNRQRHSFIHPVLIGTGDTNALCFIDWVHYVTRAQWACMHYNNLLYIYIYIYIYIYYI